LIIKFFYGICDYFCDFDMDSCLHRNDNEIIIYYACICHSALITEFILWMNIVLPTYNPPLYLMYFPF